MPHPMKTEMSPGKYFVSHSYKDAAAIERLKKQLPKGVVPHIFDQIDATPSEFVSNYLIEAIRSCSGVIVVEGGYSETSFWVAFERDYALRAGKAVYSFDPVSNRFSLVTEQALNLSVFVSYHIADKPVVNSVMETMRERRSFDVFYEYDIAQNSGWLAQEINSRKTAQSLAQGRYGVVFWSAQSAEAYWRKLELEWVFNLVKTNIVFILLDDTPLPKLYLSAFAKENDRQHGLAKTVDFSLQPLSHRIDDLIVRLYWLIYQNTKHQNFD